MGWTYTTKPRKTPLLDHLIDSGVLRWGDDLPRSYKILDSAFVNLSEFYAALEITDKKTGEREVTALVMLIHLGRGRRYSGDVSFGYKDMDETMGPVIANCPERILDLLTPTTSENANEWRQRCRNKIDARKGLSLKPGYVLKFNQPIRFTSGTEESEMTVHSIKGSRVVVKMTDGLARLSRQFLNAHFAADNLKVEAPTMFKHTAKVIPV